MPTAPAKEAKVSRNVRVDPDLWWAFRQKATNERKTLEDKIHEMLCREVGWTKSTASVSA